MANVTLNWDLPTTRQQGGPLAVNEIARIEVEMSADGGANYGALATLNAGDVQQAVVTDLEFGTFHFRIAVFDSGDQRGEEHVEIVDVADTSAPAAVQNVTVTID